MCSRLRQGSRLWRLLQAPLTGDAGLASSSSGAQPAAAWHSRDALGSARCTAAAPSRLLSTSAQSVDPEEAQKFAALAQEWWDTAGPFAPLHRLNHARCKFIRDTICASHDLNPNQLAPFTGLSILDVGCGGGLLSESMARLGAAVHGIDITHDNVRAAALHAAADPAVRSNTR